jgi:uncharacterized membrane protein YdjX (TVP38/TMEM64 family)
MAEALRNWKLLSLVAVVVGGLFLAGSAVREELGFEFSIDGLASVRAWVEGLGWLGTTAFVGLVTFRTFLLLPSYLVLLLGGLAFGAVGGTLWGSMGLAISAALQFGVARLLGDEWVRPRLGERGRALEDRVRRAGPGVVFATTAHPAGPQTAANLAAGLASMPVWEFALAIAVAAPLRAAAWSVLGTSILSWGIGTSAAVTVALGAVLLLPLMIPSVRHFVLGKPGPSARTALPVQSPR